MALRAKQSRKIRVDGEEYRWAPTQDSGYYVLAVQGISGSGKRLEIVVSRDENLIIENGYSIEFGDRREPLLVPSLVEALIRDARKLGWKPKEQEAPVELSVVNGTLTNRWGL